MMTQPLATSFINPTCFDQTYCARDPDFGFFRPNMDNLPTGGQDRMNCDFPGQQMPMTGNQTTWQQPQS